MASKTVIHINTGTKELHTDPLWQFRFLKIPKGSLTEIRPTRGKLHTKVFFDPVFLSVPLPPSFSPSFVFSFPPSLPATSCLTKSGRFEFSDTAWLVRKTIANIWNILRA